MQNAGTASDGLALPDANDTGAPTTVNGAPSPARAKARAGDWKELLVSTSTAGRVNAYVCRACGQSTVTIDRDSGITPFGIRCRAGTNGGGCNGQAFSSMYRTDQNQRPTFEWYSPDESERKRLDDGTREHVKCGGLLIRPISRATLEKYGFSKPAVAETAGDEGSMAMGGFGFGDVVRDKATGYTGKVVGKTLYLDKPMELLLQFPLDGGTHHDDKWIPEDRAELVSRAGQDQKSA